MEAHLVDELFRREGGKILAGLIRRLGDFSLAEDSVQEAYSRALVAWPRDGAPNNPGAWIFTVALRSGLDSLRRGARTAPNSEEILANEVAEEIPAGETGGIEDDRLRLIFTCCHPALAEPTQIALALHTLCGLSSGEIARAFVIEHAATLQRLVRGKRKILETRIPYEVPSGTALAERTEIVLKVIYLVFNEGYTASAGQALIRVDLCIEAIRLAHLLVELLPGRAEVMGLHALLLLQHARRQARLSPEGALVTLEEQDRSSWNGGEIAHGLTVLDSALELREPGPYQIQAAIAALHAKSAHADKTDWPQIAALYRSLLYHQDTPIVELNAAVALAMAEGTTAGLAWIDAIHERGALTNSPYLHAARADLLRRERRYDEALAAYARASELCNNVVEREYLERRKVEMEGQLF